MSYDDDHSSDPDVTPPPFDEAAAAAQAAWKHADETARELSKKLEKLGERLGGRLEQMEARHVRLESQLHNLQGHDGRGGELGRVNAEIAEGKSTRRWVMGQGIGLGAVIAGGIIAMYTQMAQLQIALESVRERQQTFESRVERTLDKLESRAAVPGPVPARAAAASP
jgi:hypothetical protein